MKILVIILLFFFFSLATFKRNDLWKDDYLLWADALSKSPEKPRVYNNLGMACERKGLYEDAMRYYKRAVELKPDYANAHVNLGNMYMIKEGRLKEAEEEYKIALRIQPEYSVAYFNLGLLCMAVGDKERAEYYFTKAIESDPEYSRARQFFHIISEGKWFDHKKSEKIEW